MTPAWRWLLLFALLAAQGVAQPVASWAALRSALAPGGVVSLTIGSHLLADGSPITVPAGSFVALSGVAPCAATSVAPAGLCTLDAAGLSSLFVLADNASFTLTALALVNGNATSGAGNGGAILAGSNVSVALQGCVLTNNTAASSGGGVYMQTGSLLLNQTQASGGYATAFGGVASCQQPSVLCANRPLGSCCSFTVLGCSLTGNTVGDGGGALSNSGDVLISDSLLSGNIAPSWGGGAVNTLGRVNITRSSLLANSCVGGGAWGGAINVNGDYVSIIDSIVDSNIAQGDGGAIYLGTYSQNQAGAGLAVATLVLRNTTLSNSAGAVGGAVYADTGVSLDIQNCTFSGNVASGGDGGGFIVSGGAEMISFSNVTFSANSAPAGRGGAVALMDTSAVVFADVQFSDNTAFSSGGALFSEAANLTLTRVAMLRNSVVGSMFCRGGAVSLESVSGGTGVWTGVTFLNNTNLAPSLPDAFFSNSIGASAVAADAALAAPGSDAQWGQGKGGAVFLATAVGTQTQLSLISCSFSGNSALGGGSIAAPGSGPFVLSAQSCVWADSASGNGGGLLLGGNLSASLTNCALAGCAAGVDGGGVYAHNGASLSLSNLTATANVAGGRGAVAALATGASMTAAGGSWSGNSAFGGAALYLANAAASPPAPTAVLSGVTVTGNSATAGGVWLLDAAVSPIPSCAAPCILSNNSALLGPLYATLPSAGQLSVPSTAPSGALLPASVALLDAFGQAASDWPSLLVAASSTTPSALAGQLAAPFSGGNATFLTLQLFGSVGETVPLSFTLSAPT